MAKRKAKLQAADTLEDGVQSGYMNAGPVAFEFREQ